MKSANAVANRECRKVSEHLGAYVAGRIESAQRGMIAEHLKNCARCCEDVKRFQAVDGLIREMGAKTATPEFTERTGQWVAAAMREEESGETQPVGAFARLGAAPWWLVSFSMHFLIIALASVCSMAIELPHGDDAVIMMTELQPRTTPPAEAEQKAKSDAADVLAAKETPATDPNSKDSSDIVVPPDILAKAELGDHFETINSELSDMRSALGNPDSKSFHSIEGSTEPPGGGGMNGVGMDDLIGVGGAASKGTGGGFGGGDGTGVGVGTGAGKGSFGNRNGGGRKLMVKRHGGSASTESAVDKALQWLAYHQEADGHWDIAKYGAQQPYHGCNAYNEGVSALALLAFLGAGHTEKVGTYHDNTARAIKWLISRQAADGSFSPFGNGNSDYHIYDTALATLALAEAHGMARDYDIKEATGSAAQKGIDWLFTVQKSTEGGWYHGHYGRHASMSLTGWVIMAMKSAKVARLKVPAEMFEGATKCLEACGDRDAGGYWTKIGYTDEPNSPYRFAYHKGYTTSAIGMVCLEFMGRGSETENLAAYVSEVQPKWDKPETSWQADPQNLYHWYYGTLALFQSGGERWKTWNESLKKALVPSQRTDGDMAGSWDSERAWEPSGGRVFTTALGALSLEVYYRYEKLNGK